MTARNVDVTIHIGLPKTGSSAIQFFCMRNRSALLQAGFYYPKHPVDQNGVSGGHVRLAHALLENKSRKARLYFRWALTKARLQRKTLLLSSEIFGQTSADLAPMLEGLNVRIVGFFRHPVDTFFSGYNQAVKRKLLVRRLDQSIVAKMKGGGLTQSAKRLQRWADEVGDENCHFIPYIKDSDESIEQVWLRLIGVERGLESAFEFSQRRINGSYVAEALELKRLLNRLLVDQERPLAQRVDWALQEYSDRVGDSLNGPAANIQPEAVARLNERCEAQNRRLVARFATLEPVLAEGEAYVERARHSVERPLDLEAALAHVEQTYPGDLESLRHLLAAQIDRPELDDDTASDLKRLAVLLGRNNEQSTE